MSVKFDSYIKAIVKSDPALTYSSFWLAEKEVIFDGKGSYRGAR